MNKMRVYELAKEMGYSSKDFLEMLQRMGVHANGNFSVLEDPTVKTIRETIKPARGGQKKDSEPEVKEAAPAPEEAPPAAPAAPIRRISSGGSVVTTIDPAAAAAMSLSPSGPKVKPGGEIRRHLPAARLQQVSAPGASGAPPSGPTAVRPPGAAPTAAPRPTTGSETAARPPAAGASPGGAPVATPRPPAPGAAGPARPTVGATPPRPGTVAPAPARPITVSPARTGAPGAAPTAPARPTPAPGRPAPTGEAPAAPIEARTSAPTAPNPPALAPSTPPPPRPVRMAAPAMRPPMGQMPPSSPPPSRPPMHHGRVAGFPPGRGGRGHAAMRGMDRSGARRHRPDYKPSAAATAAPAPAVQLKDIELPDHISVIELASRLEISPTEIIKTLMSQGLLVTINQTITFDKAESIARSHGFNAVLTEDHEELPVEVEDEKQMSGRPPVVTVLGHVDHGKTSLLDAIRKTNVTAGEAGGITQSIGAYTVDHGERKITFIDTPGHEAFTQMRVRGAEVTDVAVLVVAADDGVMPQTVEAINHAKAAKVPIVVAINKIDKPGANPDRVMQQLTEHELVSEEWGGNTVMVPVSAKQGTGLDDLLEMILLSTDLLELKANANAKARGTIIEGKLDKGLGPVATVLVQSGTLKVGDAVVCGQVFGRVRTLINDRGDKIKKAGPAIPAEIVGLSGVPEAGDTLQVVDDEKVARQIGEARTTRARERGMGPLTRTTLDDLYQKMQAGEVKDLNLIVKADSQGSVEALKHALQRLTTSEVRVQVVHGGVGAITESDILLATASSAIVIGFNVRPDPNVKKLAEQEGVDIRNYRVIYHVTEDIQSALQGMLAPEFEEVALGRVEVRQVFKVSKVGTVAGCYVVDGKVTRSADVRLVRDGVVVYEGKIESLKRFKDDAREVQAGYECGLTIEKYTDLRVGDIVEVYKMEEKKREA